MIRLTAHFSGRVQGVGFRHTTTVIARSFPVAGFVQNLPDGRVRVVAEGEHEQVQAFLKQVNDQMGSLISDCLVDQSTATGEFGPPSAGALTVRY